MFDAVMFGGSDRMKEMITAAKKNIP